MKYLLKTAVIVVIGLLAAQPVLSSLSCAAGLVPACVPGCPMATSSMAPDCPMTDMMPAGMTAGEGCSQNCCTQNSVIAVLLRVTTAKSRTWILIPAAAPGSEYLSAGLERPAGESLETRVDSPPIYILNQVFRI